MPQEPDRKVACLATDLHVQATYRLTEALVESENRMRRRIELLSEIVFETNLQGKLVFLNAAWQKVLGYPVESSLGRTLSEFVYGGDQPVLEAAMPGKVPPLSALRPRVRFLGEKGEVAWMEVSVAQLPDGGLVGTLYNITDVIKAQDELAKLSLVASFTDNFVIITDHLGRTEWVNQAFTKRTGYSIEDMLGRKPGELLQGPETDKQTVEQIRNLLKAENSFTSELLNYSRSGESYWVSFRISPIKDAQGRISRYVSIQTDCTDLRRNQEALGRLAAIVTTSEDAILSTTLSGLVTTWNTAAELLFGYTEAEMLGKPVTVLLPQQSLHEETITLARIKAGHRLDPFETVRIKKDGTAAEVSVTLSPIKNADGKVIGASTIVRSITDRKRAEKSLKDSLKEKEALLKEVHHRVKNNLQIINSLLRMEAGRNTDLPTQNVLKEMHGRVRSMALLHESLYRSSTFAAVDLGDYLQKLVSQTFLLLVGGPNRIRLQTDLASVQVAMDQALPCGLIINELISNSIKHAFPGSRHGEIRIELKVLENGQRLRLSLSDNGVGLPPDFLERSDKSLGLKLVGDLADQLNGRLETGSHPSASFAVEFEPDNREGCGVPAA